MTGGRPSRRPGRAGCLLALLLLLGPGAAAAQDWIAALQAERDLSPEAIARLPAVGRIGGDGIADGASGGCSAVLVGPDLVLTAGHCLPRKPGPSAARGLRFVAGAYEGGFAALRNGRYAIQSTEAADPVTGVGLLRLDRPIPVTEVAPLPLLAAGDWLSAVFPVGSDGAAPAEPTFETFTEGTIIAYRHKAGARATRMSPCKVLGRTSRQLSLGGCPVISGNSGAPLLVELPGKEGAPPVMAVAAVIVAHTTDFARLTLATPVPEDLRAIIAAGPVADGGRQSP